MKTAEISLVSEFLKYYVKLVLIKLLKVYSTNYLFNPMGSYPGCGSLELMLEMKEK